MKILPALLCSFFLTKFVNGKDNSSDFAREILPILSDKCFACHGPDTKKKDLVRLDLEELAKKDLGGYHAIDSNDLKESELLFRIADEDDPMPPEDFGKSLSAKAKKLIADWVTSGAEYAQHWSFVAPSKGGVEPTGNPVDHFIARGLKRAGSGFAEEPNRATLARRASLILNGLPPEPEEVFELYGEDAKTAGTFAASCLNARRMAQRGVRNIQIFHRGWDSHGNLPSQHGSQCKDIDQACYALITDLKRLGMLDDTLVVWGGEFGRTNYCQGKLTRENYGRDHHPRAFTTWMAGGGVKPGITYGQSDQYGYNLTDRDGNVIKPNMDHWTEDTMHVHDLNATILHLLGIDHRKLTYRYQGRDFRLTDIHGHVVKDIIA